MGTATRALKKSQCRQLRGYGTHLRVAAKSQGVRMTVAHSDELQCFF